MSTDRRDLQITLTATDKASKVLDGAAEAVRELDGLDPDVTITAEDRASAEVRDLMGRISRLTDDDKRVILNAEAKNLEREVRRATLLIGRLDGEEAEAILDARNDAEAKLDAVRRELDTLDRRTADATVSATDLASDDIREVQRRLDTVDRTNATARVDVSTGDGFDKISGFLNEMPGAIGGAGALMGKLASPGGAAAALAGALAAAATSTANMALDVNSLSNFTGEDFSYTDKFLQVAKVWGDLDLNDLFEIIAELQQKLRDTPELAEKFGVDPQWVANNPLQGIVALIDSIRDSSITTAEKAEAMFALFGEEGAKQLIPLLTNVESLSSVVEGMPTLVDAGDVEQAKEFQRTINDLKSNLGEIASGVGGPILELLNPVLNGLAEVAKRIPEAFDLLTLDGGHLGIAEYTGEFRAFLELMATGKNMALAWNLAYGNMDGYDLFLTRIEDARGMIERGVSVQQAMLEVFGASEEQAVGLANALGILEDSEDDAAQATEKATDSTEDKVEALEEEKAALEDVVDALTEYIDAQSDAYDASVDYREATQKTAEALENYREVAEDAEATDVERREAGEAVVDSMVAEARAAVEAARANAQARGEVLSATQAINVQNSAFAAMAARIPRELIPAFVDMIMKINDIPAEKRTEVTAAIESGDVARINTTLNNLSRTRKAAITVDANQWSINQTELKLKNLTRPRTVTVTTRHLTPPGIQRAVATGDPHTAGGSYEVGEQGREIVELPQGARVIPNHRVDDYERRKAASSGAATPSTVNYITNNYPAGHSARGVRNAARRWDRIQGAV